MSESIYDKFIEPMKKLSARTTNYNVQVLQNLQNLHPRHKVVGLEAYHLLSNGGGSFHCITQQEL